MQVLSPFTKRPVRPKQKVQEPEIKIFQPAAIPNVFDIGHLFKKMAELDVQIESVGILKEQLKQDHVSNQKRFEQEHQARLDQFDENIRKEVRDLVSSIQKGDPGKDATIDEDALAQKVLSMVKIPKPKDGDPGLDGVVNEKKIVKMVADLVNVSGVIKAPEINHALIADKVIELIATGKKKLSTKHIGDFTDGMEQTMRPLRSMMAGFRGGGDVVTAGSNITITTNTDGKKVIASTGGSGFTELSATETPNGVLTVFTFSAATAQPSYIVSDNVWMKATSKAGTVNWTWSAGTKKATLVIPPADDIYAIV